VKTVYRPKKAFLLGRSSFNQLKTRCYIILTAAGVSLALGNWGDFAIIMAVVVIDVILGLYSRISGAAHLYRLESLLKPTTT